MGLLDWLAKTRGTPTSLLCRPTLREAKRSSSDSPTTSSWGARRACTDKRSTSTHRRLLKTSGLRFSSMSPSPSLRSVCQNSSSRIQLIHLKRRKTVLPTLRKTLKETPREPKLFLHQRQSSKEQQLRRGWQAGSRSTTM